MATDVYFIRALTNLHAGSGDAGGGDIDKLVQKDPTTLLPTIHASGIKGALREQLGKALGNDERNIFGSAVKEDADKVQQGKVRFISADLLAFPRPQTGTAITKPFECITTEAVRQNFAEKVKCFGLAWDWARPQVQGKDWEAVADHRALRSLTDELPIVARNYLEDGTSKNLWYEEFVPRETVFGTILQGPETLLAKLRPLLHGQVLQIGANATVGYGYCLFTLQNPPV